MMFDRGQSGPCLSPSAPRSTPGFACDGIFGNDEAFPAAFVWRRVRESRYTCQTRFTLDPRVNLRGYSPSLFRYGR